MSQQPTLAGATPVALTIGWTDLFGDKDTAMTEQQRRDRWAAWLTLARKDGQGGDQYWCSSEGCDDQGRCTHLRGRAWCSLAELPCSINPYLTFRYSMIGMACMGAGYQPVEVRS